MGLSSLSFWFDDLFLSPLERPDLTPPMPKSASRRRVVLSSRSFDREQFLLRFLYKVRLKPGFLDESIQRGKDCLTGGLSLLVFLPGILFSLGGENDGFFFFFVCMIPVVWTEGPPSLFFPLEVFPFCQNPLRSRTPICRVPEVLKESLSASRFFRNTR